MAWLDSAPLVVLEVSLEGSILSGNGHAQELLTCTGGVKELGLEDALQRSLSAPQLLQVTLPGRAGPVALLLKLWRDGEVVRLVGHDLRPLQQQLVEETRSRLAAVSQELRAPLHGMVGLAQALQQMPTLAAPVKKQCLSAAGFKSHHMASKTIHTPTVCKAS